MVEHRTPNPGVGGSSPSWPANFFVMSTKKSKKKTRVSEKNIFEKFKEFFEESKIEMKKVAYPTQKQALATCTSVLVLVLIISVYLGVVDIILSKIIQFILS